MIVFVDHTGVVDIGVLFDTGIADTGRQLAAGVVDAGGAP
jgi:hypothetical protein